jgi:hypothetical protein
MYSGGCLISILKYEFCYASICIDTINVAILLKDNSIIFLKTLYFKGKNFETQKTYTSCKFSGKEKEQNEIQLFQR